MIGLVLVGVLLMAAASLWKRFAPAKKYRGWSPLWLELLGVGVIVIALWRFPAARWFGLIAAVSLLIGYGVRALRAKKID